MKQIAIRASAHTRQLSSVRALDDITIEVATGVIFGVLGPIGAAKTTTIRLLLNLIEPTSGCSGPSRVGGASCYGVEDAGGG